jgi:acyl transferase domain-containing protein
MACRFPEAAHTAEFLELFLTGRRSFRRLPPVRLDVAGDGDPPLGAAGPGPADGPDPGSAEPPVRAALIEGWHFDRAAFGITEPAYRAADPAHWLALETAARALADGGFPGGQGLTRDRTGVIIGNTLTGDVSRAATMSARWPYVRRVLAAALAGEIAPEAQAAVIERAAAGFLGPFPGIGEESLAGSLPGAIADRICGHFGFRGGGHAIDSAHSSSLLAIASACSALAAGDIDAAVAGGVDLSIDPFELAGLASTGALARSEMRIFDTRPTGFWLGEGCGLVVLMRASDARAAGVPAYAEIAGWGLSSAGNQALTRPGSGSLLLALRRAYQRAGIDPAAVQLIEGDGTGTGSGDLAELTSLAEIREGAGTLAALGSVKANIGHTKAAAGVAGLIKATLAVAAGVLPPTTGCLRPHALIASEDARLRVLRTAEPWPDGPRLAGVSSVGPGGTSVHMVVRRDTRGGRRRRAPGAAQLAAVSAAGGAAPSATRDTAGPATRDTAASATGDTAVSATGDAAPSATRDTAGPATGGTAGPTPGRASAGSVTATGAGETGNGPHRVAGPARALLAVAGPPRTDVFVFSGPDRHVLARELGRMADLAPWLSDGELQDLACQAGRRSGDPGSMRVALVASSQDQLAGLARDAIGLLPGLRPGRLAVAPGVFAADGGRGRVALLFPGEGTPLGTPSARTAGDEPGSYDPALQPAILAASLAGLRWLDQLGVVAAAAAGHGLGEITGLVWAGSLAEPDAARLVSQRASLLAGPAPQPTALMRVDADTRTAADFCVGTGLAIAADNGPRCQVLAGPAAAVRDLARRLAQDGLPARVLDAPHGLYSAAMADRVPPFRDVLAAISFRPLARRLISSVAGTGLPPDADITSLLCSQLTSPVRFAHALTAAAAGADLLVETGPGHCLSLLAGDCTDVPAVSLGAGHADTAAAAQVMAALFAVGAVRSLATSFAGRPARPIDIWRERIFVTSPCGTAAPPGIQAAGADQPAWPGPHPSVTGPGHVTGGASPGPGDGDAGLAAAGSAAGQAAAGIAPGSRTSGSAAPGGAAQALAPAAPGQAVSSAHSRDPASAAVTGPATGRMVPAGSGPAGAPPPGERPTGAHTAAAQTAGERPAGSHTAGDRAAPASPPGPAHPSSAATATTGPDIPAGHDLPGAGGPAAGASQARPGDQASPGGPGQPSGPGSQAQRGNPAGTAAEAGTAGQTGPGGQPGSAGQAGAIRQATTPGQAPAARTSPADQTSRADQASPADQTSPANRAPADDQAERPEQAGVAAQARTTGQASPATPPAQPVSSGDLRGVADWVRCFTEELHPAPPPPSAGRPGPWRLRAASRQSFGKMAVDVFGDDPGALQVLAVLGDPAGPGACASLLDAVRDAVGTGRLVVITTAAGLSGFCATLHAEQPALGITLITVPESHDGLRAARPFATATPGEFSELVIDGAGVARMPAMVAAEPAADGTFPLGPADVILVSGMTGAAELACAGALAGRGAALAVLAPPGPEDPRLAAQLAQLRAVGIRVSRKKADLSDPGQAAAAVRSLERGLGPVTAVVHAAATGPIERCDRLPESAVRTHLASQQARLRNLLGAVAMERLRLLLTFGSVSARYGAAGRACGALASGLLAQQAARLVTGPRCRALHVDWPPWADQEPGAGAAAQLLLSVLATPEFPARIAIHGRVGVPAPAALQPSLSAPAARGRFLTDVRVLYPGIELVADTQLTMASDPYLDDYRVDGLPMLPLAMALEAMAQAASALAGQPLRQVTGVAMPAPVVLPGGAGTLIRISALRRGDVVETVLRCAETGFRVDHVTAAFQAGEVASGPGPADTAAAPAGSIVDGTDLYGPVYFQAGRFRRVAFLPEVGSRSCRALVRGGDDQPWFGAVPGPVDAPLILGSPGLNDAASHVLQACVPHRRVLVTGCESVTVSGAEVRGAVQVRAARRPGLVDPVWDVIATDATGQAIAAWAGLRLRALGPLAAASAWHPALLAALLEGRAAELGLHPGLRVMVGSGPTAAARIADLAPPPGARSWTSTAAGTGSLDGLVLHLCADQPVACQWQATGPPPGRAEATAPVTALGTSAADLLQFGRSLLARPGEGSGTVSARLATMADCLTASPWQPGSPLAIDDACEGGWVVLRAGPTTVACTVVEIIGVPEPVAISMATWLAPDAGRQAGGSPPRDECVR